MQVQYLEIVTPDVDATCSALEKLHGVPFSEPDLALGNARTATLNSGGRIGVRAPMRADEEPVVRPYLLVDDVEAAVEAAASGRRRDRHAGHRDPRGGKFAIYFQGGIQYGLMKP